jgi:hypothetical protein
MAKSDEFLRDFVTDCQSAMRWRADIEWKLLNLYIVLPPAIVGAMFGISKLLNSTSLFWVLTASIIILITVLTILLTAKINAQHIIYEALGQQVVKVWKYFGLFDKGTYLEKEAVLDEKARGYGKGKGHLQTLYILWTITLLTNAILIAIAFISPLIIKSQSNG